MKSNKVGGQILSEKNTKQIKRSDARLNEDSKMRLQVPKSKEYEVDLTRCINVSRVAEDRYILVIRMVGNSVTID